ncbi:MAG: glycoside hydrolase family 13 protein [Clostridia bacterium]|nr:glycoside hydrolase family 13 protein [Clostridia bacterium]
MYKYNSRVHKTPFGAVRAGEKIKIVFPVTHSVWVESVKIIVRKGENQWDRLLSFCGDDGNVTYFCTEFVLNEWGIYNYRFEVTAVGGGLDRVGAGENGDAMVGDDLPEWQITVYDKDFVVPKNVEGGVIYHVFVDRFAHEGEKVQPRYGYLKEWDQKVTVREPDGSYRANDFYGGNFKGIISKLDYLASLGVTELYLSPIFEASSNHRYDTGDYLRIDPLLGTEEDFKELIAEARKRGIGLILDGVFNHSGSDSRYFNQLGHYDSLGAYQSWDSPYHDWYYFDHFPDEYKSWWGCKVVPTLNKSAAGYRDLLFREGGVIDKWTKFGIDGWRLDVVDELPTDFVDDLRAAIKRAKADAVVIGEVWEDASTKVSYGTLRPYLTKGELDGVMNYPFKEAILSFCAYGGARAFGTKVMRIYENYPRDVLNSSMTLIGTHDTVRALTALSGEDVRYTSKEQRLEMKLEGDAYELAKRRLKIASLLQFLLPGVPSVYYGDEAGLQGYEDPMNRAPYPWGKEDEDLIAHYRFLGGLRKKFKEILLGGMDVREQGELLILHRFKDGKNLFAVVNPTFENRVLTFRKSRAAKDVVGGKTLYFGDTAEVKALDFLLLETV